jgi:D-ribulokinase
VRQLLADATGKPVRSARVEEPVLLGSAMLAAVAGGLFDSLPSAMSAMSSVSATYRPDTGAIADLHDARFGAFKQLQDLARRIR